MHKPFWVLAADAPQALAGFYAQLCGCPQPTTTNSTVQRLELPGAGCLLIYRPSRQRPQPAQPGRMALALQVPQLEHAITTALALQARVLEEPRQESFGREAWLADPEGNRLLLLEPAPYSAAP
ncbi:MAG: VOC family protein [Synechococcus sp.]|nr:VOC family protein [Synechococcus sp.]